MWMKGAATGGSGDTRHPLRAPQEGGLTELEGHVSSASGREQSPGIEKIWVQIQALLPLS